MNKRTTSTVRVAQPLNYPDVLGIIAQGQHLNLETVQVAVTTRPAIIPAGTVFDAIVIVQNVTDSDLEVALRLIIPEMDLTGHRGRLTTRMDKPFRVMLLTGEVGYATMPVTTSPQTAPGSTYTLQIEIQAEPKQRNASHVRDSNGGTTLNPADLPEEHQQDIKSLGDLTYSIATVGRIAGNKATLIAQFEIATPAPSTVSNSLPHELGPAYITLWSAEDYSDEAAAIEQAKPLAAQLLPHLKRSTVFFPLLRATQTHFEGAQFRLWAGEAAMIAKLLTLLLEKGIPPATAGIPPTYPRWFSRLCRLLSQNPELASDPERLVAEPLYSDLLYDAVLLGFAVLTAATRETFGAEDELAAYTAQLVASLNGEGEALDLTHVYLPLVLGGLVANKRITMPQEDALETVALLGKARTKRSDELDSSNEFIFDLLDGLIRHEQE